MKKKEEEKEERREGRKGKKQRVEIKGIPFSRRKRRNETTISSEIYIIVLVDLSSYSA